MTGDFLTSPLEFLGITIEALCDCDSGNQLLFLLDLVLVMPFILSSICFSKISPAPLWTKRLGMLTEGSSFGEHSSISSCSNLESSV
jgi:hypothetical protein